MKLKNAALIMYGLLLLSVGCSDGRPDRLEAMKQFERLYPNAQIVSMYISEDEVIARSFHFRYFTQSDKREREIAIQFMKAIKKSQWEPNPKPPEKLP